MSNGPQFVHTNFTNKENYNSTSDVNDMILTENDEEESQRLNKHLAQDFEIKDLGNLIYFIIMDVARS